MVTEEQIPFQFRPKLAYERDDFWVSKANQEAIGWIDKWPEWEASTFIIFGPPASGKTHLSQVWKNKSSATEVFIEELNNVSIEDILQSSKYIILENIDKIIGNIDGEKNLFHIYNSIKECNGYLLMTSEKKLKDCSFKLADLESRFLSSPCAPVTLPDEELMSIVLTKAFSDKQIFVSQKVIDFIVKRIDRSFLSIREAVEKIDCHALSKKKSVTIPLVKEILDFV